MHTGGPLPQALHAAVSMYSASLDTTSRISQTVQSAKVELGPSTPSPDGTGLDNAVALLEAPCTSFVLLHQYDDCDGMDNQPRGLEEGDQAAPLITMLYRPPGVQVGGCRAAALVTASQWFSRNAGAVRTNCSR